MIEVNKGHCSLNGTMPELIAETTVAVDAIANVMSEKRYLPKDIAVKLVIAAVYNNISEQKETRP